MKEDERIAQLNDGADYLLVLPDVLTIEERGRIANVAHNMKKIAIYVVDRDASATLDARAALTAKQTELETYQRVGAEMTTRLQNAMDAGADLVKQVNGLKEALGAKIEKIMDDTPTSSKEVINANLERIVALLSTPVPDVATAAGVVTNPKEIEGLQ